MIFFVLGSHPDLSIAEIFSVIGKKPIVLQTQEVLILDDVYESLERLQERLAGSIKIGTVLQMFEAMDEDAIVDLVTSIASQAEGKNKISFGMSGYGCSQREMFQLGKRVKQQLKHTQRPVRFVTSKEAQLSSVIVHENVLLLSGGEFILVKHGKKIILGQTATVQDYRFWSDRDFGRPARDAKSGMLPPKLARIMINLSGADPSSSLLLDPFCGCGTVLAEAALLGFSHMIGSDISPKAIANTKTNLAWTIDRYQIVEPDISLLVADVRDSSTVVTQCVDVIVTETFLGVPKTTMVSDKEFVEEKKTLLNFYAEACAALGRILLSDAIMVLAVPAFRTVRGFESLEIDALLVTLGFEIEQSFLYYRPDQFVGREIFVLRKT